MSEVPHLIWSARVAFACLTGILEASTSGKSRTNEVGAMVGND